MIMEKKTKTQRKSLWAALILPITAVATMAFAAPDAHSIATDDTPSTPTEVKSDSTKSKTSKKKTTQTTATTATKSETQTEQPTLKEAERVTESTPASETKAVVKTDSAKAITSNTAQTAPLTDDNIATKTNATIELKNGSISLVDEQGVDATAVSNPVFVVDGVKTDRAGVGQLSTTDIESMEVAKDAATIKQYAGEDEAGSVVFINTKTGSPDKQ